MDETNEFNELEIETIAAAQLFEEDYCNDEQIDECRDYEIVTPHYQNTGSSCCLLVILIVLLTIAFPVLLAAAFQIK